MPAFRATFGRFWSHFAITAILLTHLTAWTPSLASFPITVLVLEGDSVPGVGLVTSISAVAVNDSAAWLVELDTDADASSDVVLLKSGAVYLREGQALASPAGASLSSIDSINLNASGNSGWNFFLRGLTATTDSGIFYNAGLVIQESNISTAPQFSPNTPYIGYFDAKINDFNTMALVASVDDSAIASTVDRALVVVTLNSSGALVSESVVAKEADTLPGQTETVVDFGTGPHESAFNNKGELLYFADLTGSTATDGVIYLDGAKVAREGDPSPVAARNYEFLSGRGLDLNNLGEVVFKANLDGDASSDEMIVVEGAELIREGQSLPMISPLKVTALGTASGPAEIDDDGNVVWFGDWDNLDLTKDTGLFINDVLIVQEGDIVGPGQVLATFNSGQNGFALSNNGRYVVFEAALTNTLEGAFRIEVQGPPPVPDGDKVPGAQVRAQKNANGTDIDVTWDVAGCPGTGYNLFYGDLAAVATYAYTGAECSVGALGQATFTPPPGDVFFLIAAEDAARIEGGHGYDSRGRARRASAGGQCGVLGQIRSARCP